MEKMRTQSSLREGVLLITFSVSLVCLLALLFLARNVVIASLLGLGLGVLISPLLGIMRRRFKVPRVLSAVCLVVLMILFVAGFAYGIYLVAADQVSSLIDRGPEIINRLSDLVTTHLSSLTWVKSEFQSINFAALIRSALSRVSTGVVSGAEAISGLVFAIIIGLYTAVKAKAYYASLIEAFPDKAKPSAEKFFLESARVLRLWFRAQLIDMAIIGVLTAVGLWAVNVPYWVLFGLITAILGIVPYIGVLLSVSIVVLIMLASDPSRIPWVIGVFFITQQVEGNLILPLVMKGQAKLPEVPLLIFMFLLGTWLGLVGLFLAPPLFAVLRVAYCQFYFPSSTT